VRDSLSDRRTFIKRGLMTGGSFALAGARGPTAASAARSRAASAPGASRRQPPNILVIMVDQLRNPALLPASLALGSIMPNLAALRLASVSFERHYTASNDCTPSRSALVTGLYTHQTRCLITGRSRLAPGFPTWGTLLREMGYETTWWGKWHLNPNANALLDQYGFSGGTYPSPNGGPGQGTEVDGGIVTQFQEWFADSGGLEPWCTTVSLVNPHDIAWWYRYTDEVPLESAPPTYVTGVPSNYQTPEELAAYGKPLLHRSLQETAARSFGAVPFTGPEASPVWSNLMNTYLLLQSYVDAQIGTVLATLASKAQVQANTIVVFTSDHGEYGGSHGMRGKGASAYEEAIRVPLYVYDPRGIATAAVGTPRNQLTSSVDVIGLLLSLASGANAWRRERALAYLAKRQDLAAICASPSAAGRPWVLHATDEDVTEFATEPHAAEAPRHVIALRGASAKFAIYVNWAAGTMNIQTAGQETEFYNYASSTGSAELVNEVASGGAPKERLEATLFEQALPMELRAPLPARLHRAQRTGLENYLAVEKLESQLVRESHRAAAPPPEPTPD
jgi:arylsulfatase A-like enzyme